jgi:hypothetical protein
MLVVMPDQELTKEEVDQRARELARRVMTTPPKLIQPHYISAKPGHDRVPLHYRCPVSLGILDAVRRIGQNQIVGF